MNVARVWRYPVKEAYSDYELGTSGAYLNVRHFTAGKEEAIGSFDKRGSEAVRIVHACWEYSGAFKGLLRDNTIPFPGKLVRPSATGKDIELTAPYNGNLLIWITSPAGTPFEVVKMFPLRSPKDTVEPYTLVTIAPFVEGGRKVMVDNVLTEIVNLGIDSVKIKALPERLTYREAMGRIKWEGGDPFGTVIEPEGE
jgi:hypothetical protein